MRYFSSRRCRVLLALAVSISAMAARAEAVTLDRGHRILIERGFQLQALVLDTNSFNVQQFQAANFTTANFWARDLAPSFLAPAPGLPWGRWTDDSGGLDFLTPAEQPYARTFTSLQIGDEQDLVGQTLTDAAALMAQQKSLYPETLIYTNQFGSQMSTSSLQNYMQVAQPDMLSMDTYNFKGNVRGGSPTDLYKHLETYRDLGLLGNDGTGSTPIPTSLYTQTFYDLSNWDRPVSTSEANLNQFAALAFGNKMTNAFIYDTNPGTYGPGGFITMMFNSGGDGNPNTTFLDQMTTLNGQSRKLGPALTRLVSTDTFMEMGQHALFGSTIVNNTQPLGVSAWNTAADPGFLDTVVASNLNPGVNSGLVGDVIVSYFKPLDESFDGIAATGEQYFMIVNGLSDENLAPSDTRQQVQLEFDFGATGISSLQRLNKDTGQVEVIPLAPLGGSRYQLDLLLDGGEGDLFKYNTGAPFVGAFLSVFDSGIGDYNDPTHWNNADGPVPWGFDVISHVAQGGVAQISADTPRVNKLYVGTLGSAGTVNQTAGNVRIDTGGNTAGDENWLFIGQNTDTGTYNQSGGTVTAHKVGLGQFGAGHGTYNLSGNAVLRASAALNDLNNPTPLIQLGQGDGNATGIMTIADSAQVISEGRLDVGNLGHGTITQTGAGSLLSGLEVNIGRESGSDGQYNIAGGSLIATRELVIGRNGSASGSINQSGGAVSAASVQVGGHDVGATAAIGAYNMAGGTLTATNELQVGGYGTGTFNQTGGAVTAERFDLGGDLFSASAMGSGVYLMSAGTLDTTGGFPRETIAPQPGSTGEMNLSGTASVTTDFLVMGDNLASFPAFAPGGEGLLSLTGPNVSLTTEGLWIGATGTLQFNADSGISTIQNDGGSISDGVFLRDGELALDLSTLSDNADLVLIENTNSSALVIGTFAGLPEGTTFLDDSGTRWVTITYKGIAGLDGRAKNDILLTNIVEEAALLDADFDLDGDVDGNDMLIWQRGFGIDGGATRLQGDADGNGVVDRLDLNRWKSLYGQSSLLVLPLQASIPEPPSSILLLAGMAAMLFLRHTDVRQTMKYTHIGLLNQVKVLSGLPIPT